MNLSVKICNNDNVNTCENHYYTVDRSENNTKIDYILSFSISFQFSTSYALQNNLYENLYFSQICHSLRPAERRNYFRAKQFREASRAPGRVLHNCTHGWKFIGGQPRRREACWKSELKRAS